MFIRKSKKKDKNTGKSYYSFQLMESYRSERGPRQRLLLNLGSDLNLEDDERKQLADRMEELKTGSASLLSYPPHIEKLAQTYFRILSKKVIISLLKRKLFSMFAIFRPLTSTLYKTCMLGPQASNTLS